MLVALWLNLSFTPCAMAFEVQHDCPHRPQTVEHEMAGHHDHAVARSAQPCAETASKCCDVETATVDSRGVKPLPGDGPNLDAVPPHGYELLIPRVTAYVGDSPHPPDAPGRNTPLHVLHCVYLD